MSAAKHFQTRTIPRDHSTVYLKKAREFYQTMYQAEKSENWNAVGLNGVHCVISLIDSLLVKYCGFRSSGESHLAVVDLLKASLPLDGIDQKSQVARRVIAKKNVVAYEDRDFTRNEALELIKHVQRFFEWTGQHL